MNFINTFFLRAKHWQIFVLLFGVFFFGQAAALISIATISPQFVNFGRIGLLIGGVTEVWGGCFIGWFWSMGSFLSSIVQSTMRTKTRFFHFACIYPLRYIPVFIGVFQSPNPITLAIIFPLHFFGMFCMFYLLYFVSKNLVMAETNKPASFSDLAGPFFLIWLFPIGIWMIQPKVNRLYAQRMIGERPDGVSAG
jgi:hypothetical protein